MGLPYHSPYKFRNGHAVFSLMRAKDVPALKAVSQNLMHSNLSITEGVYGILSENDVRGQIAALSRSIDNDKSEDWSTLIPILEKLLRKLRIENL